MVLKYGLGKYLPKARIKYAPSGVTGATDAVWGCVCSLTVVVACVVV